MTIILLSSCLAGFHVRYDGGSAANRIAIWLASHGQAMTVCPEIIAGLPTPRPPAEIVGGTGAQVYRRTAKVVEQPGHDVSDRFLSGATAVLELVHRHHITTAFLKDRSPSCGVHHVYDGTFTGVVIEGAGVTAQLLADNGVTVFSDRELSVDTVVEYVDPAMREIFVAQNRS